MTLFNGNQAYKSVEKELKLKQEVFIDTKFYFVYVIFLRVLRENRFLIDLMKLYIYAYAS